VRELASTYKPHLAQCAGMRSPKQNSPVSDIAKLHDELRRAVQMLALLVNAARESETASFTLKKFLARNQLSESQYHKLRRTRSRAPSTRSCSP
jgi:hypothetical protein